MYVFHEMPEQQIVLLVMLLECSCCHLAETCRKRVVASVIQTPWDGSTF